MAGVELNTRARLKASSIVEVIIAMVVIVVVFSIAMGIFANVQRLSLSAKKIHAGAVLKDVLIKAEQSPQEIKQTIVVDGFSIDEEITVYNSNNALYEVNLTAWDGNKVKVAELKEVIYDER